MRSRPLGVLVWLLPWACVVAVSATIAFAAGQGLVHVLGPMELPAQASSGAAGPLRQIQIVLMHEGGPSSDMQCMAYANNIASDVLEYWDAADAQQAIRSVCTTPVELMDGATRPH